MFSECLVSHGGGRGGSALNTAESVAEAVAVWSLVVVMVVEIVGGGGGEDWWWWWWRLVVVMWRPRRFKGRQVVK